MSAVEVVRVDQFRILGEVVTRSLALLLSLQGRAEDARHMARIADLLKANRAIDAHLARVAEDIQNGKPVDWAGLEQRIASQSEQIASA